MVAPESTLQKATRLREEEKERLRLHKEKEMKSAQEEKIFWDHERGEEGEGDKVPEEPIMSATSFPGQEWNPYIYGELEDD